MEFGKLMMPLVRSWFIEKHVVQTSA